MVDQETHHIEHGTNHRALNNDLARTRRLLRRHISSNTDGSDSISVEVAAVEKYSYLGPQRRWYLLIRFAAFLGLLISLVRFSYRDARISGLLVVVLMLLIVAVISLYTSTRPRRMSMDQHCDLVSAWRMRREGEVPSVDVFLPTAGEPLGVLENTYRHVSQLDYPGTVIGHVLDDAARPEVATLAANYGLRYLSREDRGHLKKAGNLDFGYARTSGDVIVVFDADFAPRADFILELMPYLDDPKVGIVQSPQYFSTHGVTSWLQRAAGATQELFYRWVQPSRDAIGAPICVGTCALYRRSALIEAGGFAQVQHSEDVHTGVALMSAGYAVRYVPVLVAKGLCPDTLSAFVNQQYRWCAGSMSLMVSPKFHHMSLGLRQRLCFWSGFGYYITTGITAFTALLPPVFLLWLDPTAIHPRNYLWLVPLLVVYPLIVLLHRGAWGFSVLRVSLIYSFAHALAVWDTYRGRTAEWVATGFVSRTPLSTKVIRIMVGWITLIQVLLWSGIVYDLARHITPVQQIWPLLGFAAFSAWIQLPVLTLAVSESRRVGVRA